MKITILIISITILIYPEIFSQEIKNREVSGIYLNLDDYNQNILSVSKAEAGTKFKLNEFFHFTIHNC